MSTPNIFNASADSINTAYVNSFRAGFEQAFQQFDTRIAQFFTMTRQASEFDFHDRIGIAEEMTEDTTRYGDNPVSEIPFDRRRTGLRDFELGKYIDPKDLIRVLTDPQAPVTVAMRASGHRKMDDIIIERIFDKAYTGKKGEHVVDFVPTPSSGKINVGNLSKGHSNPIKTAGKYNLVAGMTEGISVAKDYVRQGTAADSGLTLDKLRAVRATMLRLEAITQDQTLDCWVTERQIDDLLSIEEVINADYAVRKALAEGQVTTFMGFRFRHSERLQQDADGARRCIVATPSAALVSYAKTLSLDVWRDSSKKNIPYIYFKLCLDATRMWGELTAEVKCVES